MGRGLCSAQIHPRGGEVSSEWGEEESLRLGHVCVYVRWVSRRIGEFC